MTRTLLALLGSMLLSCAALGETVDYRTAPKFAVVVGNTVYEGSLRLRNAGNDARLIAGLLRRAGYTTELLLNTDRPALYDAISRLSDHLQGGGVGVFYYAGHGAEIKGRNYLIPVSVSMKDVSGIPLGSLPVDYLVQRLKDSGAHLSVVLLDACRNDPAQASFSPLYRGSATTGFVPQTPANGMLIAYATQPGERALDGEGRDGPFALALADWMTRPGMPLEDAINHVMTDVRAKTKDEQRPWLSASLVGDFALVPAPGTRTGLFKPHAGQNVDGSVARGPMQKTVAAPQGYTQWFQSLIVNEQMQQTRDIYRQAEALNKDDLPRLMQQAKGGSVIAQSVLGLAYRQGFGVGINEVRSNQQALKWLAMAAAQQMPFALNEIGEMYFLGHGVSRDVQKARSYFDAAAQQKYTPAQLNLFQLDVETGQMDSGIMLELLHRGPQ